MIEVTNVSSNPLPLGTGSKILASGESESVRSLSDSDKRYVDRGWFQVLDVKAKDTPANGEKDDDAGKKSTTPRKKTGGKK